MKHTSFSDLDSRTILHTPQLSIDDSRQSSPRSSHFVSTKANESTDSNDFQSLPRDIPEIYNENGNPILGYRESVPESEDDIDRRFERAKLVRSILSVRIDEQYSVPLGAIQTSIFLYGHTSK